ncbi:hypothetical protein [Nonomuraea roseola]|uniref:Uncharacterized protein n=1 Tax=Nonomuraea roseola TaxID=46179 RepID=A0ABV5PQG4_9ACTN
MAEPGDERWPGLDGDQNTVEFSVSRMRAIAREMRRTLDVMNGRGMGGPAIPGERFMTGALESVQGHARISEDDVGRWPSALAFAHTVGSTGPDPEASCGGKAGGLEAVYSKFVSTFEAVIQSLEDHAVEYEKTNVYNGG